MALGSGLKATSKRIPRPVKKHPIMVFKLTTFIMLLSIKNNAKKCLFVSFDEVITDCEVRGNGI